MLRAAKTGNIDAVKRELTGHTDVNSQDKVVFLSFIAFYCTLRGLIKGTASALFVIKEHFCSQSLVFIIQFYKRLPNWAFRHSGGRLGYIPEVYLMARR